MPNQDNFPVLDYYNYEYYRILKVNTVEFKSLIDKMYDCAIKKKSIPKKSLDKFFRLLENVKDLEFLKYNLERRIRTNEMLEYIFEDEKMFKEFHILKVRTGKRKHVKAKKGKYDYLFQYFESFNDMIWYIVGRVLEFRMENKSRFKRDLCIKTTFRELVKYRDEHMTEKQKLHYHDNYKFGALSALIAEKIFEFKLSDEESVTVKEYFDKVKNKLRILNSLK